MFYITLRGSLGDNNLSLFSRARVEELVKIYVRNALTTAEKKYFSADKSYKLICLS